MADTGQPDPQFEDMVAEGRAMLDLALATSGRESPEPTGEREQALVQSAIEAGVLGALSVLRERD